MHLPSAPERDAAHVSGMDGDGHTRWGSEWTHLAADGGTPADSGLRMKVMERLSASVTPFRVFCSNVPYLFALPCTSQDMVRKRASPG